MPRPADYYSIFVSENSIFLYPFVPQRHRAYVRRPNVRPVFIYMA